MLPIYHFKILNGVALLSMPLQQFLLLPRCYYYMKLKAQLRGGFQCRNNMKFLNKPMWFESLYGGVHTNGHVHRLFHKALPPLFP
jgi:hypothetical protein